ncbi:hypothetical protein SADUNF_Sadunf16G0216300 [Salix dunnii]|uniref:Phytocyanin domain-containing protein n=1 Tax=Salix dunnii TaxID=1413687 RepID=A0A835JFL5_9ROSI|nr:hypothetical protein SADUNF_Sadunf16G0216300 [Salix dunnii]
MFIYFPVVSVHIKIAAMISSTMQMSLFLMTILSSLQFLSVSSFEYQIGGNEGWVVPPANDTRIYNDWASENRFQVGDTVRFRYRKDSVMEVSVEDYKKCNSSHPNFFSNTGNDVYHLNRSGSFYFMSGVSGHCEKGQRMIVKVVSSDQETASGGEKSAAASPSALVLSFGVFKAVLTQLAGKRVMIIMVILQKMVQKFSTSAEDCNFYLTTGKCKFGLDCKFNRSLRNPYQYYLTTEGCKSGKSCHHSMERSEKSLLKLNPCNVLVHLDLQDNSSVYGTDIRYRVQD